MPARQRESPPVSCKPLPGTSITETTCRVSSVAVTRKSNRSPAATGRGGAPERLVRPCPWCPKQGERKLTIICEADRCHLVDTARVKRSVGRREELTD